MIRKSLFFSALALCFLSCSKEDAVKQPLADFTVTVSGQAPTATLTIVNKSTDASTYAWTFGTGASALISADKEPSGIKVDKTGDISITLLANNGTVTSTKTVTVNITGKNALTSYTDLEFALNAGNTTYGRLFSFETGKMYKDNEITTAIGSKIHLAFGSTGGTMFYFDSPTIADYKVTGASVTKVSNWLSPSPISVSDFDAMTDDTKFTGLTITETNESFGKNSIPSIILFQLADGRKGVIKTKSVNDVRILVDIKIQKY